MAQIYFQEIFSPYNKSEEYEKEFNNFELKEDTYSNKNENSFFYDKQLNSIEEQSFVKIDNSNNENKDDIFVCYDSIQCETPFERQEIPKPIVDNISKLANTKTKACTKTQKSILGKKTKRIEEKTVTTIKEKNQNLVNESIHDDDIKLLKLNSEINENLKRDYNMELMQTSLKKLYEKSTISTKYRKQTKDDANINQKAIQRIYSLENSEKEKDVKNILDKNYIDLFNDFKNKKLNDVLIEVQEEEKNKGENKEEIELYLDKFKTLCMNYEVWFSEKKGRNRSKSVQ